MDIIEIDVAIIGGGVAGMTAAIYAKRSGKNVVIFESNILGGVTGTLEHLDNYPGLPVGGTGFDLAMNMSSQIDNLGVEVVYGVPTNIDLKNKTFDIDGAQYIAKRGVILAMGAGNKKLGVPHEDDLIGKGLSYCATCDGAFFKGMNTVMIGNTNHTLSDAFYLIGVPTSVTIVVPTEKIIAPPIELEKLKNSNIKVIYNSVVHEIIKSDKNKVKAIKIVDKNGTASVIDTDGVFVAIGYTPNTGSIYGQVELDDKGYIVTDSNMKTNLDGVYAIGDIKSGSVKQIIASSYDGMVASMTINRSK